MAFAGLVCGAEKLEIYVIDVEGGKAVLFVSPSGQSMLFDAGWPKAVNGSVSNERIAEAVRTAGLKRLDTVVFSHFDIDHLGDPVGLSAQIPIGHFFDHGDVQATESGAAAAQARFAPYEALRRKIGWTTMRAGDVIPLKGVEVRVIAAGGRVIDKPLPNAGAVNPLCGANPQAKPLASDVEDDQSLGLLITFGRFRMLDLADLEAHLSHELVCPRNLIGTVDVYNVNVHGQFKGIAPEMTGVLRAPVVIQANGPRKGADAGTWPVLRSAAGLRDIWQLHTSLNAGPEANPPADFVANPEGKDGFHWLRISAAEDGSFTVTNSRNGFSREYAGH